MIKKLIKDFNKDSNCFLNFKSRIKGDYNEL